MTSATFMTSPEILIS